MRSFAQIEEARKWAASQRRFELMLNGMRADRSWAHPGRAYLNIYEYVRHKHAAAAQPELEIALGELTLDRPLPELVGERKDPSELDPQLARHALKPRDLTPLRVGQPLRAPTP